ncbi:zf-HC2 domain-containing protein [Micromonospora sp. NBC_00617]|uniref:zf-HC2 domain-containing protein n=1 Tax=Micromonospora sp. NBC_00617 TaxID=2903587 RepID=UPI0030E09B26
MIHPTDSLSAYVAGTLAEGAAEPVRAHLDVCATCRDDALVWSRLAEGVQSAAAQVAPPTPALFDRIRRRIKPPIPRYEGSLGAAPLRRAAGILAHQWRLVTWQVWAVSAVALVAGALLAAFVPAEQSRGVLGSVVPLAAAFLVAASCGTGPADEILRATLTSRRAVLLGRLTVVMATVTAGGVLTTLGLAALDRTGSGGAASGVPELLFAWLGPLVPLCALSFALSVLWRPAVGFGFAMGLWVLRNVTGIGLADRWVSAVTDHMWAPGTAVFAGAVAVVAVTVFVAPRRIPGSV